MTEIQRIKSDRATMDKRDMADKTVKDSRSRNDKLTGERRYKADKALEKNRLRNDDLTAGRRDIKDIKDGKPSVALAAYLLILGVFVVAVFSIFI